MKFLKRKNIKNNIENTALLRVWSFIKERKLQYSIGVILACIMNVLQLVVPKITGDIVDYLNTGNIIEDKTLKYVSILIVVSIMIFCLHFLSRQLLYRSANFYAHLERSRIFNKVLSLSMNFFTKRSTGEIMALTTNDVKAINHMLCDGIYKTLNIIVIMASSVIIISNTISLRISLLIFIPIPIMMIIIANFGIAINKRFKIVQDSFSKLTTKIQENISGIRVIKAFTQEEYEINNFKELNKNIYTANMDLVKVQGLLGPLIKVLINMGQFFVLFFGGSMVIKGTISLGSFIALNSYLAIIMVPLYMISQIVIALQKGSASFSRIDEILQEKPDIFDNKFSQFQKDKLTTQKNNENKIVEFKDVSFSYSEDLKPVLKNISFSIEKEKTLGIIGKTGSGKSTIISLIMRLYDTQKREEILINGIDVADIPLEDLRNKISYVPQENYLFSDTVKNNINFMPIEHSMEEIIKAASSAQIHKTISEIRDGYDTKLGERGINISGGTKAKNINCTSFH